MRCDRPGGAHGRRRPSAGSCLPWRRRSRLAPGGRVIRWSLPLHAPGRHVGMGRTGPQAAPGGRSASARHRHLWRGAHGGARAGGGPHRCMRSSPGVRGWSRCLRAAAWASPRGAPARGRHSPPWAQQGCPQECPWCQRLPGGSSCVTVGRRSGRRWRERAARFLPTPRGDTECHGVRAGGSRSHSTPAGLQGAAGRAAPRGAPPSAQFPHAHARGEPTRGSSQRVTAVPTRARTRG
jgi:hypothetical protein